MAQGVPVGAVETAGVPAGDAPAHGRRSAHGQLIPETVFLHFFCSRHRTVDSNQTRSHRQVLDWKVIHARKDPPMIRNPAKPRNPPTVRRLAMTALAPLLVWGTSPAQAQPDCGDPLGPGGHIALYGDVGPCATDPALTIVGPVNVDLNGFTVSCAGATTGIVVEGVNARVQNGVVEDCEEGVVVEDDGHHRLLKLTVTSTQDQIGDLGFRVNSDNNHLVDNWADAFNGEGFRIEGDDNRLTNNHATDNFNHGFRIRGENNQLVNNHAENNVGEGFRLDDDGNHLINNVALDNADEGFRIRDGLDNTLVNNRAENNGTSDGEPGIRIQEDGNTLRSNAFIGNFGEGILVKDGAENNRITHNVASGNVGTDLVDENPDCDDNQWSKNRFGTRSQDCIE
jgi:parallel beta-helix repeat protein